MPVESANLSSLPSDFWALQANAPYIGVQLLVFLLQAPESLRDDLLAEIDASLALAGALSDGNEPLTFPHLASTLPLLGSAITETLRLGTSTFSIRNVEQPFVLPTTAGEKHDAVVIPANTRLICATRLHHLSEDVWGGNGTAASAWDGRRFADGGEAKGEERGWRSRRARHVYGFGGGISRVRPLYLSRLERGGLLTTGRRSARASTLRPPSSRRLPRSSCRRSSSSSSPPSISQRLASYTSRSSWRASTSLVSGRGASPDEVRLLLWLSTVAHISDLSSAPSAQSVWARTSLPTQPTPTLSSQCGAGGGRRRRQNLSRRRRLPEGEGLPY